MFKSVPILVIIFLFFLKPKKTYTDFFYCQAFLFSGPA